MLWFFGREACGILAPRPGIEPTPPALEGKVLTAGPPGKSPPAVLLSSGSGAVRACSSFSPPSQESLAEHPAQATHLSGVALLCLSLLLSWNDIALKKRKKLLFSPGPYNGLCLLPAAHLAPATKMTSASQLNPVALGGPDWPGSRSAPLLTTS